MSVRYQRGALSRVVVDGTLDEAAAHRLAEVLSEVVVDWPRRVELDLSGVTGYTDDGLAAVSSCLQLCRRLDEGLGITVATDAGRRVLLDSMATV